MYSRAVWEDSETAETEEARLRGTAAGRGACSSEAMMLGLMGGEVRSEMEEVRYWRCWAETRKHRVTRSCQWRVSGRSAGQVELPALLRFTSLHSTSYDTRQEHEQMVIQKATISFPLSYASARDGILTLI